jgi:hypothetical protein
MQQEEHYEVRHQTIEQQLKAIGRLIDHDLPDGWGFMLFLFSFGEGGSTFYISNARREDMLEAMQEWIDRQKGRKP